MALTVKTFKQSVELLRALAEPTRCRLLALLQQGELTVGELAAVVDQSQPRISRHLRLLSAVGVLERFQEEQRVYYRLATADLEGTLPRYVLQHIAPHDVVLKQDRTRLTTVLKLRARNAAARWVDARQSAASSYADPKIVATLLKEVGGESLGALLDVGTGAGNMLRILAAHAQQAVGLDISTQALRVARTQLHGLGLSHCVFKRGDMYDLPFAAHSFDAVSFDHVLAAAEHPVQALREAIRILRNHGRMIVVEDIKRLSVIADVEPKILMGRWFKHVGVCCEKITILRGKRTHLIMGLARCAGRVAA